MPPWRLAPRATCSRARRRTRWPPPSARCVSAAPPRDGWSPVVGAPLVGALASQTQGTHEGCPYRETILPLSQGLLGLLVPAEPIPSGRLGPVQGGVGLLEQGVPVGLA